MSQTFRSLFPQLAIFPLRPIPCDCRQGAGCDRPGKHPAALWSELGPAEKLRGEPGCGYGICTGTRSGLFIVDLDNDEAIQTFGKLGGTDDTFTVATPRGAHLYYQLPDFQVRRSLSELAPGIDILGEGSFAVAPGSPHKSGGTYEVCFDVPVAPAPAWLLAWPGLRKALETPVTAPQPVEPGSPAEAECVRLAIGELLNAPAAVSGQKGHGRLWIVAQILMRRLELPLETAYALIVEHYNPRCVPPWSDREIRHKLEQARDHGRFALRSEVEAFDEALRAVSKPPALLTADEIALARAAISMVTQVRCKCGAIRAVKAGRLAKCSGCRKAKASNV